MPTNYDSSAEAMYKDWTKDLHTVNNIDRLEAMAMDELANFFSCLKAQVSSTRPEFMAACAKEFKENVLGKIKLASSLVPVMVQPLHDRVSGEPTNQG